MLPVYGKTGPICPISPLHGVRGTEPDVMANPVLVDTDIMVDFLRGRPNAVALVKTHSDRIILSSIVAAELYAGVKGDEELNQLDGLISLFRIVPVSIKLARAAGLLKNRFAKSHGVGLADAIIAATAEAENADLKTLNTKHYPMLKGLKPAYTNASEGESRS
jgi:predicted nucleic acid-binding protein